MLASTYSHTRISRWRLLLLSTRVVSPVEKRDCRLDQITRVCNGIVVTNRDKLQVLNFVENSLFTDEVWWATKQLRVLNQYGDAVYALVAPCTTHMNMEINNEVQGLDPLYDLIFQCRVCSPFHLILGFSDVSMHC